VVSTEGRVRNQNSRFMANGGGQYRQYLVVLINAGSAMALRSSLGRYRTQSDHYRHQELWERSVRPSSHSRMARAA
jgi:hypothetical protein